MKGAASLVLAAAALLAACSEKPQTNAEGVKHDAAPSTGTASAAFAAPGWKAGDKAAWEQQIKMRMLGQNDYAVRN